MYRSHLISPPRNWVRKVHTTCCLIRPNWIQTECASICCVGLSGTPSCLLRTHWRKMMMQVVGDDYLVTSAAKIRGAATKGACNAALIKPNQVGTITETRDALKSAQRSGFATIVSARSGDSEDTTIVHLATGLNAGQLKVGSFSRSERMCKWNEGIRIETN